MSKMQLTKKITKTVVSYGVKYCVSGTIITLVHYNTPTFSKSQKAQLYVGAAVVGWMVSDAAADYVSQEIDDIFAIFEKSETETDDTEQEETPEESPN